MEGTHKRPLRSRDIACKSGQKYWNTIVIIMQWFSLDRVLIERERERERDCKIDLPALVQATLPVVVVGGSCRSEELGKRVKYTSITESETTRVLSVYLSVDSDVIQVSQQTWAILLA